MSKVILTDAAQYPFHGAMEHEASGNNWSVSQRRLQGGLRDGVELIEVRAGDLSFSILPTRGMGLWKGRFNDIDLGWQAPIHGPVHPKFVNQAERGGLGWLTGFDEWLCRCGLNWNGPPGEDQGRALTLHGRIANTPAHYLEIDANDQRITILGEVEEAGLFHARLELRTIYLIEVGSNTIYISDTITNRGGTPAEMQLLYHCNLGPPLLGSGSQIHVPIAEMWPMTQHAAAGLEKWNYYDRPQPGFVEQVYCIRPLADADGNSLAVLHDAERGYGLRMQFPIASLPCFTVWKNTAALVDGYVTGLEPATNFPRFRAHERAAGRVKTLVPGESWSAQWSMEFADQTSKIDGWVDEIAQMQLIQQSIVHKEPLS
jgi:hypothetical protein